MKNQKKLWTIKELIEKNGGPLPMSAAGLYKCCAEGKIPYVKIGSKLFIRDEYIQKILKA